MLNVNKSKVQITAFIALIYMPARLLFNADGDPSGAFQANSMLYANAVITLFFTLVLCSRRHGIFKPYFRGLFGISLAYYLCGLVSAAYSPMPAVTLYQSMTGVLFTLGSASLARMVENSRATLAERFELIMDIIFCFSIVAIATNAVYFFIYFQVTNFFTHGIPSDFVAVLVMFYIYKTHAMGRVTLARIVKSVLLFVLVLFLKSFSALATFFVAFVFISIYERKYMRALALLVITVVGALALYQFALSSIGQGDFMGKPAEAYLTGSGRFGMYGAALDVFVNDFSPLQQLLGGGFMAERVHLMNKDLPWITDPHNSIILSGLGLGIVGLVLYVAFAISPFFTLHIRKQGMEEQKYLKVWIFFHVYALLFGLTSSFYIGRPSFLAIFSLAIFYVIHPSHYRQLQHSTSFTNKSYKDGSGATTIAGSQPS